MQKTKKNLNKNLKRKVAKTERCSEKQLVFISNLFPFFSVLLLLCLCIGSLSADPWGKDADIVQRSNNRSIDCLCPCATPLLGSFAETMIAFHQKVLSPADGPRSHFLPSSSRYTLKAMRKYGFYRGFLMGCDRLTRENSDPWVYRTVRTSDGKKMKLDPVP